jgi:NAD(P)H-dependent flavin oxidoreductase YrpB (nitropropane dioxygenase family)
LASDESEVTPAYKKALLLARDTDTVVVRSKSMARRELKDELLARATLSLDAGAGENEAWPTRSAGEVAGLIHEILPAKEMIARMVQEARDALRGWRSFCPNKESSDLDYAI